MENEVNIFISSGILTSDLLTISKNKNTTKEKPKNVTGEKKELPKKCVQF